MPDSPIPEDPIKVLIVEDQTVLADALARLIAGEPDLEVVGCVATMADAVAGAAKKKPDVVLMDFSLPDGDGVSATRLINANATNEEKTAVVMLTGYSDPSVLERAIEAGCSGFLTKDRAVFEVVSAVRRANEGETVIEPGLLTSLLARLRQPAAVARSQLSRREAEVLILVSQGLPNRDIAERMFLSVHTIRSHLQNLMTKLDAHSKLQAVAKGIRLGLIPPP